MKLNNLSDQPDILRAALVGYQTRQAEVERKILEVRGMLAGKDAPQYAVEFEDAWKILKPISENPHPFVKEITEQLGIKPKRRAMSPEARERISAATRLRWKRYRREKRKAA